MVHRLNDRTDVRERRRRLATFVRVLPAVLFVAVTIFVPIAAFLTRAVDNSDVTAALPRTAAELRTWDRVSEADDGLFAAVAEDLAALGDGPLLFQSARTLNYFQTGFRSLLLTSAEAVAAAGPEDSPRDILLAADPRWGEHQTWQILANSLGQVTPFFLLAAVDLTVAPSGDLTATDPERAIFIRIFTRTIWMSVFIAGACVLLGYPVAYLLANTESRLGRWALYLVLLPLWTSLLVRTVAWIVIFQKGGIASSMVQFFGGEDTSFLNTRPAVIIGMIHVMLPFMIVAIYAVMRGIPKSYMRAAVSLGAHPLRAFFTVYLPQSAPGIGAGVMIVAILSLGFYITPALLGSPSDQLISYFIAFYTNESLNWGMASALSVWLLIFALALFFVIRQTTGIRTA